MQIGSNRRCQIPNRDFPVSAHCQKVRRRLEPPEDPWHFENRLTIGAHQHSPQPTRVASAQDVRPSDGHSDIRIRSPVSASSEMLLHSEILKQHRIFISNSQSNTSISATAGSCRLTPLTKERNPERPCSWNAQGASDNRCRKPNNTIHLPSFMCSAETVIRSWSELMNAITLIAPKHDFAQLCGSSDHPRHGLDFADLLGSVSSASTIPDRRPVSPL